MRLQQIQEPHFFRRVHLNKYARTCGMIIVRQRPHTAKGTVFATLEDEHGHLDLIFHKATYEKYRLLLLENSFLIVQGRVQREGNSCSVLVEQAG
jgi:error-prone DNA polymerase